LKIYVLHVSVATQLKRGRIFNKHFIANRSQYVPVKESWKSVNIWRRYEKWQSGTFLRQCSFYEWLNEAHGAANSL